jgi:hypothetical protein
MTDQPIQKPLAKEAAPGADHKRAGADHHRHGGYGGEFDHPNRYSEQWKADSKKWLASENDPKLRKAANAALVHEHVLPEAKVHGHDLHKKRPRSRHASSKLALQSRRHGQARVHRINL